VVPWWLYLTTAFFCLILGWLIGLWSAAGPADLPRDRRPGEWPEATEPPAGPINRSGYFRD
jgi:hypothetical protein